MQSDAPPDPSRCPLCGDANACAVAADPDAQSCWCFTAMIPSGVLERVPAEARGVACVCARCAAGTSDEA